MLARPGGAAMAAMLAPFLLIAATVLVPTLTLAATPAALPQQQRPPTCDEVEGFHALDFWLGDWSVADPEGSPQGRNRIEKILDGCAVTESWVDSGGNEGKSLFYFNPIQNVWKQVWVTPWATLPGGLKEKQLVETLDDGSVRFQGVIVQPDGSMYLDRTTLTPMTDGRVRQVIETSTDGGVGWEQRWVGIYARSGS